MAEKKVSKLKWGQRRGSLFSLFNGLASKKDEGYVSLRSFINRGKVTDNLRPYTKTATDPSGQPYESLWLEGPYGAFAVVKTKLPIDQRRMFQKIYQQPRIQLEDAYGLLFSPYPDLLDKAVYGNVNDADYPCDELISSHIDVHAAYLEKELMSNSTDQTGEKFVDFSWVQNAVQEHLTYNDARIKAHGMLYKDSENVYRNGSTVIWFEEDKKQKGKYNAYYYGNPEQGEDMLYFEERMMRKGKAPRWLRFLSQKINDRPINWYERDEFMRQQALNISKDNMRNQDPYFQFRPDGFWRKTGFTLKQFTLRTIQNMANDAAKIDTRSMGISMLGTAALYAVLLVYKLALSLAIRGLEIITKGGASLFKSASRYAMPPKMGTYRYLDDYAHLMAVPENKKPFSKKAIGRSVDGLFVRKSEVAPSKLMGAIYPNAVPFSTEGEKERTEAMLLDTTRYPIGTIVSRKKVEGRQYLEYKQPDGLTMTRDIEQQIGYIEYTGKPLDNTYIDNSVRDLFADLPEGQNILAIKFTRQDGISSKGFMTLEHAISSTFVPDQAVTREEVAREVADIESGGAHKDITVEEILLRHHNTTVVHSMLGTLKSLFKEKAREVIKPKKEPYKPSSFTESPTALDIRRMNLASNRMQSMR
jgi:hypothetical protein